MLNPSAAATPRSRSRSTADLAGLRRRRVTHLYTEADDATALNETAQLAAQCLDFPIAQINIVDDDFQHSIVEWNGQAVDPDARRAARVVLPRRASMCQFTVERGTTLAVDDLCTDLRYARLPGVRAGVARSYLGVALRSRESDVIGTLCVLDPEVRHIAADDIRRIVGFGRIVEDQLDLMRRTREASTLSSSGAAALASAIEAGEIVPWYQPIVDLESGRTRSYEALARWMHPSGEIEAPGHFVPGAEDSQLVVELDLALARQAVADLARWRAAGRDVGVSINVSPLHLELEGGVDDIYDLVDGTGVDPSKVTLELTETRRLENVERAARAVADLRSCGFPVVLDDFGSGCASLDWLMTLPITGLKIDRAVTSTLDRRIGRAVTRAATGLAHDLGLTLTLEGISTGSHAASASEQGYHLGQGYFWSRPEPAEWIDDWTDSF